MANVVGKVAFIQGQAFVRAADGSQHALKVGDPVLEGEVIVTGPNSRVELAFDGGQTFLLREQETVTIDQSVIGTELPGHHEAALLDRVAETSAITRALAEGSSLDELLEETSTGMAGGGAGNDGHSFVELMRVVEAVPPLAYQYGSGSGYVSPELVQGGHFPDVPAPRANDDSVTTFEGHPVHGNVLGNDQTAGGFALAVSGFSVDTNGDGQTETFSPGQAATIAGVGTLAISADGAYTFTPASGYVGTVPAVTYTADNGHGSSSATLSIAVTSSAPTLVITDNNGATAGQLSVNEAGLPAGSLHDGSNVATGSMTLTAPSGLVGIDVGATHVTLAQLNSLGATPIVVTTADGVLTLTGFNAVTGVLSYSYSISAPQSVAGTGVTDSVDITVQDSAGRTASATLTATIVDDNPIARNDPAAIAEDAVPNTINGTVLGNDAVGADTSATPVTPADVTLAHGHLVLNGDGTYTYTLNNADPAVQALGAGQTLTESYVYTLTDGDGDSTTATLNITINGTNDAPVARDNTAITNEDTAVTIDVRGNDSDIDGDTLAVSAVTNGAHGTVALDSNGNPVYTPAANWSGTDSFTYTISDGHGGTSTATVSVTVNAINDAPIATADVASTAINAPVTVPVRANDTDVEGDSLTVAGVTSGAHGTVTIDPVSGNPIYTPATNWSGTDSFTYTISDGHGGTATATVSVTVGANTPPTGQDATFTLVEDGSRTFAVSDFGFADTDLGQTLQAVRIDSLPSGGSLTYLGNPVAVGQLVPALDLGNLVYAPALNGNGSPYASFNFSVQDSGGAFDTTPNTITLNVTPVNDAAVITPATLNVTEGNTAAVISGGGTLAITDVDSAATFVAQNNVAGSYGHFSLATNGVWTYTADSAHNEFVGGTTYTDSFTVTSADGTVSTVTVNILGTNDAPTIAVPGAQTTSEDATYVFSSANSNAISVADVDGGTLTTTLSIGNGVLWAVAVAGATISNNGTGTVTINGTAAAINSALNGLSYIPTADYNGGATLTVSTSDGIAPVVTSTVGVTVTAVADIANDAVTTAEDTPVIINVNANDSFENAGHTITAVNGTAIVDGGAAVAITNGTVALVGGQLLFTPSADFHGTVPTFTYTVSSGGVTETANVNVTVTPGVDVASKWIDYWQFNEGSGTTTTDYNPTTDQLGTITDAVPHSGQIDDPVADLRPTWTTGRNGSTAIQFNGVGGTSAQRDGGWVALDTSVTDPLAGQSTSKAATLSFWIKTTQSGPSTDIGWDSPSVIGMENNGGTTDIQWGFINSTGKIGLGMADNAGVMSTTSVNDGQWHQVVITHNFTTGGTLIYVDGTQEASSTLLAGMVAPNKFLGFGVTADDGATSDRFLNGALEDVRIYDSVLTSSQAQAIYETELMGNQNSVIANDGHAIRFALNINDATSTILSGLPNGTVVTDGTHSVTVGAAGTADISSWSASEVSLSGYGTGSFLFNVTGTDALGHSASEFLSVVTSADMYTGTTAADTLSGAANSHAHVLSGGAGNDTLIGGAGNDLLIGGTGNDTMTGGTGADVFSWSLADAGTVATPASDTVTDFNAAVPASGGDILDLRDLLVGETHTGANAGNLASYLHFSYSGGNTIINVQSHGAGVDQVITM
ncbi:MAG TPA: retention module-containing protein, partial [Rhodocyclaceae bacterium]|nr:retention module-containing protein [Rhodocyclaceae bacterium]